MTPAPQQVTAEQIAQLAADFERSRMLRRRYAESMISLAVLDTDASPRLLDRINHLRLNGLRQRYRWAELLLVVDGKIVRPASFCLPADGRAHNVVAISMVTGEAMAGKLAA